MAEDCLFCKIIKGEVPARKVYEDENYFAFLDVSPVSKGHTLVVPKKHYPYFLDMPEGDVKEMFSLAQKLSTNLKESFSAELVFLIVMGEEVPHTHVHLIPYYGDSSVTLKRLDGIDLDEVLGQITTGKTSE